MHNVINLQLQRERRSTRITQPPAAKVENVPRAYTVEQVAAILRVSKSTVYKCVETGQLPSLRLRRRIVIPVEAIEALLSGTRP